MDYTKVLTREVQSLAPSGIRRFFSLAEEIEDCISLGVGEPDFSTPWIVRRAGIESLERGKTWYSANAGFRELRVEISNYLKRRMNLTYNPDKEVMVTVGGSEAIDMAMRACLEAGDELLLPTPSFVCYEPIARMCGAKVIPLVLQAENDFRLTAQQVQEALTPRTKMLVLPFPNNPTGSILEPEDLKAIAEVLKDTNVVVLSDEIYAELTYGQKHVSPASLNEDMWQRTITVNGFSKAFAMTGWRLGYACAPAPLLEQMLKLHQYAIMCAPSTAQYAGIVAMRECDETIEQMRDEYDMRRRFLVDGFNRIGLTCFEPKGAFYVFPSIQSTGLSSEDFCEELLYGQKIAVVPGNAFGPGGEGHIRVSYSYSLDHLKKALRAIETFVKEKKGG